MKWLDRVRAEANAMPKTKLDVWIQKQRAIALRLPRWLVGTSVVVTLTFGIWCVVYQRGLWRPAMSLVEDPVYAALFTAVLPLFPVMIALWVIAKIVKPNEPSNLPTARVER